MDTKSFRSHYGPGVDSASNRNEYQVYFLGGKGGLCVRLMTLLPSCAVVMKSGNLKFLEPSGPLQAFNPLTPNDDYSGRTSPLTSKRCIFYMYSTNIGTEYFKHGIYSPFFSSSKCSLFHKSNISGFCIIHILYRGCAKIKRIIPAPKG